MRSMTKTPIKPNNPQLEFPEIVPDRPLPSWNETARPACSGECGSLSEIDWLRQNTEKKLQMLRDLLGIHRI